MSNIKRRHYPLYDREDGKRGLVRLTSKKRTCNCSSISWALRLPTGTPVSPLTAAAATFHPSTPRKIAKDSKVRLRRETMMTRELVGCNIQTLILGRGVDASGVCPHGSWPARGYLARPLSITLTESSPKLLEVATGASATPETIH